MSAPEIRCFVAWQVADNGGLYVKDRTVSLSEAADYHALGWVVLVDPADEIALAAWEREQRPWNQPRWKRLCNGD